MDAKTIVESCRKYADLALSISNREFYNEIADFITEQEKQIKRMRNCRNCANEWECASNNPLIECDNKDSWEWEGGSGETR
jgi:hypothetical protein